MSVAVNVRPIASVIPRKQALYWVVSTFGESLGLTQSHVEILHRGIVQQPLIQSLDIFFLNGSEEAAGMARIEIDWERHEVLAGTPGRMFFKVRSKKSLYKRVMAAFPVIEDFLNQTRREGAVQQIRPFFPLIRSVTIDPVRFAEALAFLGLVPGRWPKWANARSFADVKYQSELLPELQLTMTSAQLAH
jgi:hypothetical protein